MVLFSLMDSLGEEERAFVWRLYEEYGGYMYRSALEILKNKEDAEDAVQEILVRIIRHLDTFRNAGGVESQIVVYVRAVTHNTAVDLYRQRRRRGSLEMPAPRDEEDALIDMEDESPSVSDVVLRREAIEKLRGAVTALSDELKDAVTLFYLEGYSMAEACEVLGIPLSRLKSRLYRARQKLKKELEGEI